MATPIQRIHISYDSKLEIAKKYYKLLFDLNNLKVTDKEAELVAFSSIHGTISTPPVREALLREVGITMGSAYNMMSKLQKMGILVKDNQDKIRIHHSILPDFSKGELMLVIKLDNETKSN